MKKQVWMNEHNFAVANMVTGEISMSTDVRALKHIVANYAQGKTELANIRFYSNCERSIEFLIAHFERCVRYFEVKQYEELEAYTNTFYGWHKAQ